MTHYRMTRPRVKNVWTFCMDYLLLASRSDRNHSVPLLVGMKKIHSLRTLDFIKISSISWEN